MKKLLISAYDSTDRLREMRTRGREGVKNPENFAYVLNGSPLSGQAGIATTKMRVSFCDNIFQQEQSS